MIGPTSCSLPDSRVNIRVLRPCHDIESMALCIGYNSQYYIYLVHSGMYTVACTQWYNVYTQWYVHSGMCIMFLYCLMVSPNSVKNAKQWCAILCRFYAACFTVRNRLCILLLAAATNLWKNTPFPFQRKMIISLESLQGSLLEKWIFRSFNNESMTLGLSCCLCQCN